jgi:drug/metabolite transporter (DMT)-like permease
MSSDQRRHRFLTVLCFGLVYVFWGSTYLGIDIAVQQIPPALMCGVRFLVAGILMLLYCRIKGESISYQPRQMMQLAVIGILLLMGGNLTLSYAELYVPTGLSALLLAITPLWFLVLDTLLLGDHRISSRGLAGLALGAAGTVVLLWPELTTTGKLDRKELWFSLGLIGGSLSWAFGSVLSKRWHPGQVSLSATGWQITFAGLANMVYAIFNRDFARAVWTPRGLGAMLYLVIGGSWIGYSSYIWLLGHVPTAKVSTYSYVNPVVAVFLGWLVLKEPVDKFIVAGSVIVVASVVLVTSAKVHSRTALDELPAVEAIGD